MYNTVPMYVVKCSVLNSLLLRAISLSMVSVPAAKQAGSAAYQWEKESKCEKHKLSRGGGRLVGVYPPYDRLLCCFSSWQVQCVNFLQHKVKVQTVQYSIGLVRVCRPPRDAQSGLKEGFPISTRLVRLLSWCGRLNRWLVQTLRLAVSGRYLPVKVLSTLRKARLWCAVIIWMMDLRYL